MSSQTVQFRQILVKSTDEQLASFLQGYVLGGGADIFIAAMNAPDQRVNFLLEIAQSYPEDWQKANELLRSKSKK